MSRYVITIAPETDGEAGAASAHSTMRVDVSSGQTRITELTIRSVSGEGLAPADLPPIDLDLLVRALTAPQPLPITQPVKPAATAPVAEPPTASRRPRKATTKAGGKGGGRARKAASRAATANGGARAYRRMPDPEQVMDIYRQTGSIAAVAEHFEVPRHTAAGWARRLRAMGYPIGRQ